MVISLAASTTIYSSTASTLPRVSFSPLRVCEIASQKRRKIFKNPLRVAAPPSAPSASVSEGDQENVDPLIEIEDAEESSSSKFSWRDHWYPVSLVEDLDPRYPTPFQLLNRDLVLWFDNSTSQWVALDDKCPHRLAPLSVNSCFFSALICVVGLWFLGFQSSSSFFHNLIYWVSSICSMML